MSRGRSKTAGQRLGRLTGFALIVGGVAGWTWSLLQAPGKTDAAPVAIPKPPAAEPDGPAGLTSAVAPVVDKVKAAAEKVDAVIAEDPVPSGPTEADPDDDHADEPAVEHEEVIDDLPVPTLTATAPETDLPTAATRPAATASPAATPPKTEVPDAVKAIRAAAAAARERLETPAKASPDAAVGPARTDTGE